MTQTKLFAALLLAGTALGAQYAHAADGTITFNGMVTAQTCTINGNGSGSKNFSVNLPTVSASTLQGASTAGRTPFSIALTNCTPTSGNVHTFFESGATTDLSTGNLILDSGPAPVATNVQIGLLNADASPIKAGFADAQQNSKAVALNNGAATLQYYAQYVSTGNAGAGSANSSVMYTIAYE
ncbi:ferrous iron transporter B [Cupriavidus sp. TA19]|uniref:fimbrial protein n=1 Tax=unclassified Cupriavidus TaxID=2640874 RepID=UPI000E2F3B90|nr:MULTISPECIES: fimbrial protein [unclassified Cupriavidus]BDB27588.1 type 1 fimbrial protein [Cupriavidus sp. P-10]GLC91636.1 ferrous iron transporter B [Cupriavidus sp. TA19]